MTPPGTGSSGGAGWWSPVLSAAAGLVVLGGATAAWVVDETGRDIAGVEIVDTAARSGAEIQPGLLVVGVALLLAGVLLAFLRGMPRRVLGLLVIVASVVGVALAAVGLQRAAALAGALRTAAWVPLLGSLAGVGAGLLAARAPGRRAGLPARYDLPTADDPGAPPVGPVDPDAPVDPERDGSAGADEWELATDREDRAGS